jgi:hypothetical protein
MLDQSGAINWDRFKSLALRKRKKLTQRHPRGYLLPATVPLPVRTSSREIVAG